MSGDSDKVFGDPTELLQSAEELAGVGHWTWDIESGAIYWSPMVYRIHGVEPGSVEPTFELVVSVFAEEDRARFAELVENAVERGERYSFSMGMTDLRGVHRVIRAQGVPRRRDGKTIGLFGVIQDITEQARIEEHYRMLSDAIATSPQAALLTDAHGRVTWLNDAFTELTGYTLEEVEGLGPGSFLQGPGTAPDTVQFMREHIAARKPFKTEILNYDKEGDPHWVQIAIAPRWAEDGTHVGFASIQFDITERREAQLELERQRSSLELVNFKMARQRRELQKVSDARQRAVEELEREVARRVELEAELRRLAGTDELSGVANRRAFLERAEAEIARASRTSHPMAVLMFDIDRFKSINDRHGHSTGDDVIRAMASILVEATRKDMDVVGRLGGEEFAVLLPETSPAAARDVAARILEMVRQREVESADGGALRFTCSVGVTMLRTSTGESVRDVLVRADEALYAAKHGGRDQLRVARSTAAIPVFEPAELV